ncbi:MAG: lysine--tRNA ligase [Gemmatimonadaceae bacterium]|nr:lysine--tRNA ligase [Gemmatimonadaceae bacterium]
MATPNAWPFTEAQQISKLRSPSADRPVLFQTGYGPSGLPHIGTFAEVARTTFVQRAFEQATGLPSRLQAFSDDMDGLRKVPLNVPNGDAIAPHLGKPLHAIPDPFGCCDSFSGHGNTKLREFLDAYGFDYELKSAKQAYRAGELDAGLSLLLHKVDEILDVILPTLREENRQGWSPFFPICTNCGSINATRVTAYHPERDSVSFICDRQEKGYEGCGHSGETSILGGNAKVGWKVDWALRWFAYDVDYEMSGKDLIDSVKLSSRIVRVLGKRPPAVLTYELFLDEEGKKISKSVGNGLSVEHWVDYAPIESLLFYLYQNPKRAKRLYWDVVPKAVDDYLAALRGWPDVAESERPAQPLWHVTGGGRDVPEYGASVNFSVVTNLISALGSDDEDLLMEYLRRYDPEVERYPEVLAALVHKGLTYYREQVLPGKQFRDPSEDERSMLQRVHEVLAASDMADESQLQSIPFDVAREAGAEPKDLFRSFYEVVLGQARGPRFGSFVMLVGKDRVLEMLKDRIAA